MESDVKCEKWQPKANLDHLPERERKEIEELLFEECDVFARSDTDIGDIQDFEMDIKLTDEIPVNQAYRHLPRKLYDDVKNYLNDLIVNGWIRESDSPYASPIVCVRKKDNSLRLCVDYRRLNLKTIPDRQPIPRVQDLLDGLHGQRYFSTLDMAKAYHQGYVRDICRKYTAFSTPWALMEWTRVPFGLKNAPAAFQKYINKALSGLLDKVCLAYLDDILIYGRTFKEHKTNLRLVLKRLKSKGVKLRVDKCEFVKPEVRYLGRLVSAEGYRADPKDVEALDKFRDAPKTVGEVRSLLGFLGYYRNYVKDFARKLQPVYDLLKIDTGPVSKKSGGEVKVEKKGYDKRRVIQWDSSLQARVDDVINILQSPAIMAFPDFEAPFILHTDASGTGLGAVLYQKQGDSKVNRVISYASRTLNNAEKNYHLHSGKLEFLALKWAVCDKFSDYLGYGGKFTVFTDNNPLTYVMTSAKLNATGMRWVADLAGYDFVLKYRPGKDNGDADGLSRRPLDDDIGTLEKECTEWSDRQTLADVLAAPVTVSCASLSADVLQFPDTTPAPYASLSKNELSEKQNTDSIVGPVYKAVCSNARPDRREWQALANRSKLLFRQWNKLAVIDGVLVRRLSDRTQVVLPEDLHSLVYTELHQKMGHLGHERVLDLARRRFFWPHMGADIDSFIKKRCSCVITKKPNTLECAPLVPICATRPFEMVSIDYVKLDKCKGGFEYILTVVDHFTRFAQAYPTRKNNGRSAADKIFNQFILQFGYPDRIHHDQGREFNGKLFAQLHHLTGIKKSNTTPYHPEGDGQCERLNRTIINMLKSIPDQEKKNWKDHLAKLTFAYNSTVNKTTQFSPFFLLFGREPRLPIDDVFPDLAQNQSTVGSEQINNRKKDDVTNRENFGDYVKTWDARMTEAFEIANKNIGKSGQYSKQHYDRKRKQSSELSVGDRVLVKNVRPKGTTRAGKLAGFWEPTIHEVLEKFDGLPVYVVREWGTSGKKTRTLHRNLLKQVNELAPLPSSSPVVTPLVENTTPLPGTSSVLPSRSVPVKGAVEKARGVSKSLRSKPVLNNQRNSRLLPAVHPQQDDSSDSESENVVVVVRKKPLVPVVSRTGGFPSLRGRGSRGVHCDLPAILEPSDEVVSEDDSDPEIENSEPEVELLSSNEAESEDSEPEVELLSDEAVTGDLESEVDLGSGDESDNDGGVEQIERVSEDGEVPGGSRSPNEFEETLNADSESEVGSAYHSTFDDGQSSVDLDETFYSTFNNSLDLESDEEPPRRGTRERRPPKKMVYDELGKPGFKPRPTKILVHDTPEESKPSKKRSKRRYRK